MRSLKFWLMAVLGICMVTVASAHINPNTDGKPVNPDQSNNSVNFRDDCDNSISQIDQAINNVRARLLAGGDVWWDGSGDGRYVVPKVPAGVPEVSSIFAGAVWLGGVDPAGNLKLAAQTYGTSSGNSDFFSGPLEPNTGKTSQDVCADWDRFFTVTGEEIEEHLRNFQAARDAGESYDPAQIPKNVRGWPGKGNEFFFEIHQFELPNTSQGLAGFFDQDLDGTYNPELGDYPVIEIRGCTEPQFPDEMIFWIYNDAGNIHSESQGDPIQMEIQVQAFSYQTNDEINDMTFQRYKLINRAIESIDSMFFAMWVDPDLGCFTDDYVGCDTLRSLGYVYNEDAADGETGCACQQGVNTYCENIPILGVDYFRGPLDENFQEIGMSSFTYYNNGGVGSPAPGTTDPNTAPEFYNYLSGSWRDGSPFTFGDDAYQDGEPINYAFTDAPDNIDGWSMCTEDLPFGDRRTIQASGPFRLDPGAVNELIVGVVWVPDQQYPCPSIRKLQETDDIAQALFDNCFEITDGPDAPDVDWIELDQEIIAVFTNDTVTSNNAFEEYAQLGLQIPPLTPDSLYRFEGYKLFQLAAPDVTIADLDDVDKARLVAQVDIQNGVSRIFNWETVDNPTGEEVFIPVLQVEGNDNGIRHTFRITEDQFADTDRRLVNHRKYYFTALAYAYNEYEPFDPNEALGQRQPYLEGRNNIGDGTNPFYTVIPRPIVYDQLNAVYGDGAVITRIDGIGTGTNFLDVSEETRTAIVDGSFNGEIVYEAGQGPIDVLIYNPLEVKDGQFELTIIDDDLENDELENPARWTLRNLDDPSAPVVASEKTLDLLNEQIVTEFGFTITIGQVPDAGSRVNEANGAIGYEEFYTNENASPWFAGVADGANLGLTVFDDIFFNYIATGPGQVDEILDPDQGLSTIGTGWFSPYMLCNWRDIDATPPLYLTPAWTDNSGGNIVRNQMELSDLNNVDIVFTSNKDLWSRCVIVEGASRFYADNIIPFGDTIATMTTEGDRAHFDLRAAPNVTQFDNDGDGLPDIDTEDPGEGMGWFPGYAIDVETGQRLNIFFAENTVYDGSIGPDLFTDAPTGRDMMFNPDEQLFLPSTGFPSQYNYYMGGQHMVYVTKTPYDSCALFRDRLEPGPSALTKVRAIREITWAGLVYTRSGEEFLSYNDGLIPEDLTVKLRVNNPYQNSIGTGEFNGYPTYRFTIEGKEAEELQQADFDPALQNINIVPNPYKAFSEYETSEFDNFVRITNLPPVCDITIFTLDGKFIRRYNRAEVGATPAGSNRGISQGQEIDFQEWDLNNSKGIPVASGVYLIHIDAGELGERTLKFFMIGRQFDPSNL